MTHSPVSSIIRWRASFASSPGWRTMLVCGAALLVALLYAAPVRAQEGPAQASAQAGDPLCRFGVNVASRPVSDFDVAALRIGWYIDYYASATPSHPGGAAYMPVVLLTNNGAGGYNATPSGAALDAAIAASPGAHWIIGNEPDRREVQGDLLPAVYAQAYHDLYQAIKAQDPTARIFAGAIVQPTPLRLQYLDEVLRSYINRYNAPMPVDGWAIHNFILNERSCVYWTQFCTANPNDPGCKAGGPLFYCWGADVPPGSDAIEGLVIENSIEGLAKTKDLNIFKEQIERFRQWMYDRGYGDKPLYLSEYGILMPESFEGFDADAVNLFMTGTFDYLLTKTDGKLGYAADGNRLVQRFSWYSTVDSAFNGNLFRSTGNNPEAPPFVISTIGLNYQNYTTPLVAAHDVTLQRLTIAPAAPLSSTGAVTFTLRAVVANAGSAELPTQATVRFYDGNPTQGGAQIGVDQVVSLAGCGETAVAQVTWPNIGPEAHGRPVYVRLTAPGVDQSLEESLFFATSRLFLGTVQRIP